MFRDADDETGSVEYDFGGDLLNFDPPPPRTGPYEPPGQNGAIAQRPSYDSYAPRSTDYPQTPSTGLSPYSNGFPSGPSTATTSLTSPGRDRMPSSTSATSMSSSMKGRRAPAPAALDLSPRREQAARRNPYDGLGYGTPSTEGRRVATDSFLERVRISLCAMADKDRIRHNAGLGPCPTCLPARSHLSLGSIPSHPRSTRNYRLHLPDHTGMLPLEEPCRATQRRSRYPSRQLEMEDGGRSR